MTVVSDSSPIIALARAKKLSLLRDLFGEVLIPNGVYRELAKEGRAGAREVERGLFIKRERVTVQGADITLVERLGQADAEVIILAREKPANVILIDDLELQKQITQEGLTFLTTVRVLLLAKRQGFLASVKDVMDEMRRQGVGIRNEVYQEILREAGEIP